MDYNCLRSFLVFCLFLLILICFEIREGWLCGGYYWIFWILGVGWCDDWFFGLWFFCWRWLVDVYKYCIEVDFV